MEREIHTHEETDGNEIASFLQKNRIWAGYAICDLEKNLFPLCEWYSAREDDKIISICLYFKGFDTPTQITVGDPSGIEKILQSVDIPEKAYAHIPIGHREIVEKFYSFKEFNKMRRMGTNKNSFKAVNGPAIRLQEQDLTDLEKLYAIQSGTFFSPYMLTSGVYYGIRENGELVSTAGTHACSPTYSIACVGNVLTHPSYRGRGYATICTSNVVDELLINIQDIVLNVNSQNIPAIEIYKKLGFYEYCSYFECLGLKRLMRINAVHS